MHTCINMTVRVHRMGAKTDGRRGEWRGVGLGWVGLGGVACLRELPVAQRASHVTIHTTHPPCGWMGGVNCPLMKGQCAR